MIDSGEECDGSADCDAQCHLINIFPPSCVTSDDCGINGDGPDYCYDGDVYHDWHEFSCNNEACSEQTEQRLTLECGALACVNNLCQQMNYMYQPQGETVIIFAESFETWNLGSADIYDFPLQWNAAGVNWTGVTMMDIGAPHGKILHVDYPGGSGAAQYGPQLRLFLDRRYEELWYSFDARFQPGFNGSGGGKMFGGFLGGPEYAVPMQPDDGFTAGMMFKDGPLIMAYTYHHASPDIQDANFWEGDLVTNQWYNLTVRAVMNTPGVADGIYEGFIDGVLAFSAQKYMFRPAGHPEYSLDSLRFMSFYGGTLGPVVDSWIEVDNLRVFFFTEESSHPRGAVLSPEGYNLGTVPSSVKDIYMLAPNNGFDEVLTRPNDTVEYPWLHPYYLPNQALTVEINPINSTSLTLIPERFEILYLGDSNFDSVLTIFDGVGDQKTFLGQYLGEDTLPSSITPPSGSATITFDSLLTIKFRSGFKINYTSNGTSLNASWDASGLLEAEHADMALGVIIGANDVSGFHEYRPDSISSIGFLNIEIPWDANYAVLWVAAESGYEGLPITLRRDRYYGETLGQFSTITTASLNDDVGIVVPIALSAGTYDLYLTGGYAEANRACTIDSLQLLTELP